MKTTLRTIPTSMLLARHGLHRRAATTGAALALAASLASPSGRADDKSGVQPTHVILPKGPGSLGGVGENAEVNVSMGLMTYGIDIEVPPGYEGTTPKLRLAYSSGAGTSEVGIGWSLSTPSIERMTARVLPQYTPRDTFVADGSDELVRVGTSSTYRARYESSFVRYTWVDAVGTGKRGYWKAEYPDGTVGYFGARASGVLDDSSVAKGPNGTFRYYLTELADPFGHIVRYDYLRDGVVPLLYRISYVYEGLAPRYQVSFAYETRPDLMSDSKPGFQLITSKRMTGVTVKVRGTPLRRYALAYEPVATSGGLSRLVSVQRYGVSDQGPFPVSFAFAYSGGLGSSCVDADCAPYVRSMDGDLGFDLRTGTGDLVDLNGDSLPDVVNTTTMNSQIYLNTLSSSSHGFASAVESSQPTTDLSLPSVQLADLDGNGFADMFDAESRTVLWNTGTGDWSPPETLNQGDVPPFNTDANLRFFDYNNDKQVDLLHSDTTGTWYYVNQGKGQFKVVQGNIVLGASFSSGQLHLADINGDNLVDAVQVGLGFVQYRLNLGWGTWTDWVSMANVPAGFDKAAVEDVNGDGLADVVLVVGSSVSYALNQNAHAFGPAVLLQSSTSLPLPNMTPSTTLRFADMNGNGSTDVVWFDQGGHPTYLELFPTRPNLITSLKNGLGKEIRIKYGSSVAHMIQDGGPSGWRHRLPHAFTTVDEVRMWDSLTNTQQVKQLHYSNGYYDSIERRFRGYTDVQSVVVGDASAEQAQKVSHFDVGDQDVYRKGLLLSEQEWGAGRELSQTAYTYGDCDVGGVTGTGATTAFPVRFLCRQAEKRDVIEGQSSDHWVTIEDGYAWDPFANVVKASHLGVTQIGGAPCGASCTGDERFELTTYVSPDNEGGRWLLHKPSQKRVYGKDSGDLYSEEDYFYDGTPFVGLAAGTLSNGLLTRTRSLVTAGQSVDTDRRRYDVNGAVVETMDANGHHRSVDYDADSILPTGETVHFDDPSHPAYDLRLTATYDPLLETAITTTAWTRSVGGQATSPVLTTQYAYDAFGRVTSIAKPGDALSAPTEAFAYNLADPASQIIHATRSQSGQPADLIDVQCFDGLGRLYQKRAQVAPGLFQASGFTTFNAAGTPARQYQSYSAQTPACDQAPPPGTLDVQTSYDAQGRVIAVTQPDADLYGGSASAKATTYLPQTTVSYDEEQAANGRFPGAPTVTRRDGLGRIVALERFTSPAASLRTSFAYDDLGRLVRAVDPAGNTKTQVFDLLGRVVSVQDPDSGVTTLSYDAAGNKIASLDARGALVHSAYDEANRLSATWSDADPAGTRVDYTYDAPSDCPAARCTSVAGRLAEVRYPVPGGSGVDWAGFDGHGNATYFARNIDGLTFAVTTAYDNADRVTGSIYPNGRAVRVALDGMGRVAGIPGIVTEIDYDARGLRQGITFASGARSTYSYDARSRLSGINTTTPLGTAAQAFQYAYDRVGDVLSVVDTSAAAGAPSENALYTYDALHRLHGASLDSGRGAVDETLTFDYDAADNMVRKASSLGAASPDHVGTLAYGESAGPHAVTTAGGKHVAYDPAGHMVTRDGLQLAWDHQGRMTSAQEGAAVLASFVYGAETARVKKVEGGHTTYYVAGDYEVRDGAPTLYVRLGSDRIARIEGASAASAPASAAEALGLDADAARAALLASAAASSGAAAPTETITYLHHNQVGSITTTTDRSGTVTKQTASYPFGVPRVANQSESDYAYTGMERDDATALTYFGARYLDSWTGSWTSADPAYATITDPSKALLDRFGYASHNPASRIDPDGNNDRYVDANFSIGFGVGITFGSLHTLDGEDHVYIGYGFTSPTVGFSFNASNGPVSEGWGETRAYSLGPAGYSRNFTDGHEVSSELGAGLSLAPVSASLWWTFTLPSTTPPRYDPFKDYFDAYAKAHPEMANLQFAEGNWRTGFHVRGQPPTNGAPAAADAPSAPSAPTATPGAAPSPAPVCETPSTSPSSALQSTPENP